MMASLNMLQQLSKLLNFNSYNVRSVCVGFVVDEVALDFFFLRVGALEFV